MSGIYDWYAALWIAASVVAIVLAVYKSPKPSLFSLRYRLFLFQPWKLATFGVAVASITLLAPLGGDPSWDYGDSIFMSVLTFLTAPWAVGICYRARRRTASTRDIYVAVCAALFSSSWSQDLYLWWRDGRYPEPRILHLAVSLLVFLAAGALWSLDHRKSGRAFLAFAQDDWPSPVRRATFHSILGCALLLIIPVALVFVALPLMKLR